MADYSLEDEEYRRREYMFQAQEWNKKVRRMYNQNKLVDGVTLSYETVFGINYQKIHRNLINVGEGFIIFSVGTSIAIKDLQTKTTKFFTKENRLRNISCLNAIYEKDENILIAVGESTPANEDRAATVTLINTKENKWTHMNTNLRAYIKEIIIETDKKYCAALVYQFQASYPQILFWNYQKEKMIGQAIIKIPIEKMSFDPIRPKQILIQTPMYLRVWELDTQDKTLKEAHTQYLNLKKEGNLRVLDHCWLPHGNNPILLILVNNNILHIAQNDTIKKTHNIDTSQMSLTGITKEKEEDDVDGYLMDMEDKIDEDSPLGGDLSPMSPKSDSNLLAITQGVEFSCIAPTKKGFILGGSKGIIGFYEIEKSLAITNALSYQCPNPEDCKVVFVSTNQNDSITSAVTANVSNGKFNYFLLNIFQIDSTTSPVQQFFNTGYHSMAVTSMSVCRARSILATCSDDGYVKLWNYFETEMDEKKGFITQYFKETPSSVSIHPCSQFLAVAFGTFYKIFAILSDSLQPLTTVNLTSCKLVKYTNGGHYLIANERSNIIIFDTVYYDALHIFDSHTSLIKDFVISEDDKYLVSTCEGGFIYVWDLVKPEKNLNKEWRHKNTMYNKILYDCESDLMYGCTGEKPVCVYGNLCKEKVAEFIASNTDHDTRAAVISTKHQVLFTGTNKGTIKVFLWPMVKESFEIEAKQGTMGTFTYKFPECVEYNVHLSPVTYLEVSHDGNYLFSGAADGSVFIFKITDVNFDYSDAKKGEKDEKQKLGAQANDIYLEKLSKIKEQNEHIKKLHFEVTKGQQAVKIELKKLEMMFKSKIETINEEFHIEMKANSEKKDKFTANAMKEFEARDLEHGTLKNTYVEGLKHSIEENKFKEEYEIQRNKDIEKEMEDIKVAQQAKLMEMYKKYQKELETLRNKYQEKCQGVQAKYNAVTDQAKASGVYFLQKLEKHEADCERENEEKTKELIIEIAQEKHVNKGLVEINSKLHSKNEAEKRMDTEKQNKLDEVIAKNNRLKEENINHMASLLKMQEQILEREEVILSKEETCKAARDEQINLENFRYLLDQKIKTLTNEKDSMLDKISSQEKLLKDTFQELITESGRNDQKHEHLKKKETKVRVMNIEQQKVDMEIIELRNRLSDSINNLDKVIGNKEKEKWPEMLHSMLDKARNANAKEKVSVKRDLSDQEILEILKQSEDKGFDVNDELLKQAKWITKKLYLVNVTGKKLRDIKEESIQGILGQNGQLIEECNMLRTENETLSHKMKFLEKVVQDGMKKMKKMENTVSTPISMKMNKSQVKLEKISSTVGSGDETQMSPIKDPFSSPDVSAKKKLFNSEQKARNLLGSNKYSPDTLSKKTKLASVSPQKSSKSSTSKSAKGLGFMLHEVPNQGL